MSEGKAPATGAAQVDLGGVEGQLHETRGRLDQLVRFRKMSRLLRYLMFLLLVVVFFGWVFVIYSTIASHNWKDELAEVMKGRSEPILTRVSDTVMRVFNEVRPAFSDAITEKLQKGGPAIGAQIDLEVQILQGELEAKLKRRLEEGLAKVAKRHRTALAEAFPQLAQKPEILDQMMMTVKDGFQTWATKQLVTTLKGHVDALLSIKDTLTSFKVGSPNRPVDGEEILGLWLELFYEKLGGDEALEPSPVAREAPPEKGAEKKRGGEKKKRGGK